MDPHSQPSSNTEPSSSTADPVAPLTNAVSSIALDDHHHGMGSPPLEATQNPWSESVKLLSANSPRDAGSAVSVPSDAGQALSSEKHRPSALDPNVLDDSIAIGLKSRPASPQLSAATTAPISSDILSEFDPLASSVEQEAREAWESSESHPPPPPPRSATPAASDTPPAPPNKDSLSAPAPDGRASPSIIAAFPSLSALARTFSIPTPLRGRPLSVDSPQSVPSPNTISSFASQQQDPARPSTAPNASSGEPDSRGRISGDGSPRVLEDAAPFGSGTRTPETGQDGGNENAGDPPFDFQKFLDQMKSKGAEPVAKYLRSFLSNFAKRTFTVSDQVKIINDFLNFISLRMRETDTWKRAGDIEFDNAMEGMEKLVMNRLYDFTFTPQIARAVPPRPITTDDLERDRVLFQRISLFGWIEEKHLDIPVGEGSKGFLMFAQQELLKINHYKAPRDKLICILNCCKVIFGLIRHLKKEEGADSFVPILIYVVLKANPDNLLSNVEFISRFRNPEKLQSEAGYYLSSLVCIFRILFFHTQRMSIRWVQSRSSRPWTTHRYLTSLRRSLKVRLRKPYRLSPSQKAILLQYHLFQVLAGSNQHHSPRPNRHHLWDHSRNLLMLVKNRRSHYRFRRLRSHRPPLAKPSLKMLVDYSRRLAIPSQSRSMPSGVYSAKLSTVLKASSPTSQARLRRLS
ncbi:hypothetical protein HGRIS_005056 [Hohenbuehelia grisea]|uniref:VPS9 domain-containing protein n=1 Tax=Hohenbuehelia grisea TaxID=104357 RepID=A0ABR3JDT0_9AGAR